MAKKKATKKAPPKARAKKTVKAATTGPARKAAHRQPAAATLPGMEQVRDVVLDRLCESLGEEMAIINEASARIKSNKSAALARMRERNISKRIHGGVRLVLHEGTATLSVKLVKETTEDVVERTAGPSTVTVVHEEPADGIDDDPDTDDVSIN